MRNIPLETRKLLKKAIASSGLISLEDGSKHAKVRHVLTGDWIPVSGTPSDHRSTKNFEASLRRLTAYGQGVVAAKKGMSHMVAL